MVTKPQKQYYTIAEWLAHEYATGIKHEYIDGEIYAMSGGTGVHSEIASNVGMALKNNLRGQGCHVYNSDLRVRITDEKYVYPDASALCGTPQFRDENNTMLVNPTLVVEVVSKSSAYYDTGLKADYYFSVPSVQVYLVIDQNKPHVHMYSKTKTGWSLIFYSSMDATVPVSSLNIELPLSELYLDIEFDTDTDSEDE